MEKIIYYIMGLSLVSLLFAAGLAIKLLRYDPGTKRMREISDAVHKGAMTFLKQEYKLLAVYMIIAVAILWFFIPDNGSKLAISFVMGGVFSVAAGNIGMRIATKSNARAAFASKKSLSDGLHICFSSGSVMGLSVVGLGLLGVSSLYLIFKDPTIIYGFGFGASSVALFARVGGGIYTKAADVGADLVGKVEAGIPEDDPRNPAVIADNVGDNVGDVAGMGADLFESYVDSIIAAMVIGVAIFSEKGIILPLALAGLGIISSIIGTLFVRSKKDPEGALNKGIFSAAGIMILLSFIFIKYYMGSLMLFYASAVGLAAGIIIGLSTEYYTSADRKPVREVAQASKSGAGTNVIAGLSLGMISTVVPIITISGAIIASYSLAGLYGIAIAAVGLLSTLAITLASDAYGPVADNAAGIAEMANMGEKIRKRCEKLDAVGNTTAAVGKGFAIGSAALTALALFTSYIKVAGLDSINMNNPFVIAGVFIGALLPFIFSGIAIKAVGKTAEVIVQEVRRQFKEIKGLMQGRAKPDYEKCIEISTNGALKNMILPSLIAILTPVAIGLLLGKEALGGMLGSATATAFLMAIFMANAGGAWDNAKKYIEEGNFGGKGSDCHKAAVVGDTVGDPFKDTAGPALNILIKLMSIVALVFLPLFL